MESYFNFLSHLSHGGLNMALNGLWLGVLLTGLVWLIRRVVRVTNAASGYLVWWVALAMVFMLPFLMNGPLLNWSEVAVSETTVTEAVLNESSNPPTVAIDRTISRPRRESHTVHETTAVVADNKPVLPLASAGLNLGPSGSLIPKDRNKLSIMTLAWRFLPLSLFGSWLFISLISLSRLWLAYRRMVVVKRAGDPLDPGEFPGLADLWPRLAGRRGVKVSLSDDVDLPMAAGLGRPKILIPRKLVGRLTSQELEAVILHEMAHLLRWDDWTKLWQRVIESLMFFNPLVFWIGRRLDLEREIACDDLVVRYVGRPREYARCLTKLTQMTSQPQASLIPGVLTSHQQIFHRFERLLSEKRNRQTRYSRARLLVALLVIVSVFITAVRIAPVVAVPLEAVTFDEFYQTVQALAQETIAEVLSEQSSAESPVATIQRKYAVGIEKTLFAEALANEEFFSVSEKYLTEDEVDPDDFRPTPVEYLSLMQESVGTAQAQPGPIILAANDQAAKEEVEGLISDLRSERVVDWNDKIFAMPISGTIHTMHTDDAGGLPLEVWIDQQQKVRAAWQGRVRFTTDRRGVAKIGRGGWLAIKERDGKIWRELDVQPNDRGLLKYAYYQNGKRRDYDDDARRWFGRILQRMIPEVHAVNLPDTPSPAPSDIPEPRFERGGLFGRLVDWAIDPFVGLGNGLMISHEDDDELTVRWSDGKHRVKIKSAGEVEFAEDDRSIVSITPGGYFAIWEKRGSQRRELDVEPGRDGTLSYGYYLNGRQQNFDDATREWLANLLIKAIRETGIGAEARVERILQQDGVDGVLAEIGLIQSDYVKRIYFGALLDADQLTENDYGRILHQVKRLIDSDYEKTEILIGMAERVQENNDLIEVYVEAVGSLDSDYETRRALSAVSFSDQVGDDVIKAVLQIADRMDSDYEKAELLIGMAPYCQQIGDFQETYVKAVVNLDSDYETRRVLSALSLDEDTGAEVILTTLQIAGPMDSDYEKAELLIDIAPLCLDSKQLQAAYVEAVVGLNSDYEMRRVLSALIKADELAPELVVTITELAGQLDSDYEKAELLLETAQHQRAAAHYRVATTGLAVELKDHQRAQQAYLTAVAEMESDYESRRVLTELIAQDDLDENFILGILEVVSRISSDYDKAELLKKLVDPCREDPGLEEAFIDAVETIDSDYEKKELYSLFYRQGPRQRRDFD